MIFEQQNQTHFSKNKKKISEKNLGKNKIWENKFTKNFWKKICQLQVTIPSAYPVQISSRLDYCITLT